MGPFLTFEVIADGLEPTVSAIRADGSAGRIATRNGTDMLVGYAAYGRSIAAAVQPLVDCFDVYVFDDGDQLREPSGAPLRITARELGSGLGNDHSPSFTREQSPLRSIPSTLRLSYYDLEREYQIGGARAKSAKNRSARCSTSCPRFFRPMQQSP